MTAGGNASARFTTASRKSLDSSKNKSATEKLDLRTLTYSGDYLDRHKDRFVNETQVPFMPRTKKRKGKSFLSQSRHYAPPAPAADKSSKTKDNKSTSSGSGGGSNKGGSKSDTKKDNNAAAAPEKADMTADNLKELEVPELEIER